MAVCGPKQTFQDLLITLIGTLSRLGDPVPYDEYLAHWGASNLTRWSRGALTRAVLPDSSIAFLETVGLPPTKGVLGLDYRWEPSLPEQRGGRRVLGRYHSVPLLLDETAGGCVIKLNSPDLPGSTRAWQPERWYNSSVEQFALFLTEFSRFFRSPEHVAVRSKLGSERNTPRFSEQVDMLEKRLAEIDHAATDPNGPWGLLLWETRTGITD